MTKRRHRHRGRLAIVAFAIAATMVFVGGVADSAPGQATTTINVDTLPIANGLPLTLGIQKGFFAAQGLEIKTKVLQSGNDIVLAMANGDGDVGYIGYTPAILARTQGIPMSVLAASETEGTSEADNWQNIMARSSSIRTPADLAGKTIALNALKGVAELDTKGALEKSGVDPNSPKYVAMPFPAMPAALANGQIDAVFEPEPFMSQILNSGGHIVMAPGPILGKYWPNGCYCAREDWIKKNPGLVKRFRAAINQSLVYANGHPDEVRALLPAATRNIRLPTWSPLIDRVQLLKLAQLGKKYGIFNDPPEHGEVCPVLRRGRQDTAGRRRPELVPDPQARREGRDEVACRQLHDLRLRPLGQGQLPSQRSRCRQVDERREEAERDVDPRAEEGRVLVQVRRNLEEEGDLQGRLGTFVAELLGRPLIRGVARVARRSPHSETENGGST